MSSLTALTGRLGKFSIGGVDVARATSWAVNPKLANKSEWGDSDSAGYTNRAAGRRDCTFSAEGKFDTGAAFVIYDIFQPEDVVAAKLHLNDDLFWDFPRALCDDFKLTVNIDTEEVIGWTSEWGADGVFTAPA